MGQALPVQSCGGVGVRVGVVVAVDVSVEAGVDVAVDDGSAATATSAVPAALEMRMSPSAAESPA